MLRTGGVRVLVSKSVEAKDLLLFRGLLVKCPGSSWGRRIGLDEELSSGVVGRVEPSSTISSESANDGDGGIMAACFLAASWMLEAKSAVSTVARGKAELTARCPRVRS